MHSDYDREKLRQLYDKYKNRMYITACKVLRDPQRAEDAVHDAFIAVSKHLDKIKDVDSVSTAAYMIKAARSRALNIVRMGLPEKETPLDEAVAERDESLLDEICRRESYKEIVSAILRLEDRYRDVLTFYYLNDLSVSEIAALTSTRENTVKQQLFRGRQKLINLIKKEEDTYEKREYHA
ncbi:MAG: sigma-70 family RNA polymerase sigma factor [Clostridia bacterium]|nr:sigma-70 family RNA polymerase sigma factor [Clostridia bacterium]